MAVSLADLYNRPDLASQLDEQDPASGYNVMPQIGGQGGALQGGDLSDVTSLLGSGALPQQQQPQQQQGGGDGGFLGQLGGAAKALLSLPLNIAQGYSQSWADVPNRVAFAQLDRRMKAMTDIIGMNQAQRKYQVMGQLLDQIGGQGGQGSAAGPPGAPGAVAAPGGTLPQTTGGGGVQPSYVASPQTRKAIASMAILDGKSEEAAKILSGNIQVDREGHVYDSNTGQHLYDMPHTEYVNGFKVNTNDPNAPGYLPTLPAGVVPGPNGVAPIQGYPQAVGTIAQATEGGKNAANWPGQQITVQYGGKEYPMSQQEFAEWRARQQCAPGSAPGGVPGAAGPGAPAAAPAAPGGDPGAPPGVGNPTKAQEAFNVAEAGDAQKTLSGDMSVRQTAMQSRDNARQALAFIQANPNQMNQALPYQVAGANYLRSLPPGVLQAVGLNPKDIDQLANSAATYQRLANQGLLEFGKTNLPSRYTERELALGRPVIGGLSTAPDAATYHWAQQQAIANKQLQRADFAANYSGDPSRQAIEKAWNASQQGKADIYEDPVWQHVKLGGQPAVQFFPDRDKNKQLTGRTVGVIGAGTASPQTFYPSWSK
jgi:hypothetical protein